MLSCYASSPLPLFSPSNTPNKLFISPKLIKLNNCKPSSSSVVSVCGTLELGSWDPPDPTRLHLFNGWDFTHTPPLLTNNNIIKHNHKGLPMFLLLGIGTSIATLAVVISQYSISSRGLSIRLGSPLHALHRILMSPRTETSVEIEPSANGASNSDTENPEGVSDELLESMALEDKNSLKQGGKLGRILIPTALDSTQQEALSILRKLKIIEEDIKPEELCTRREYARWLVRANSLLERNPKYCILPPTVVPGSISAAFDDIHAEDPDFEAIQALAEAGIVRSKLAGKTIGSYPNDKKHEEGVFFFAERFLSRQDLIDWKAQLDYDVLLGTKEKILGSNLGFMDVRDFSTNASPGLFADMLAGDKSIFRRVFGQGKRFQPNKPAMKAQAAVALTSGRMIEAINAEIERLRVESISRQKEMELIGFELLEKGDIQRFWDKKLEEERARASEVERAYLAAIHDLEQENISREKARAVSMKQRAAMDCQREVLLSLKEEIHEMSKRLTVEKVEYTEEQRVVKDSLADSKGKLEQAHDAKSILEAEIESLRILRSWIEDETKKTQARVKVLEEVEQRWKWDDRS